VLDGRLYFLAAETTNNPKLWSTDGTAAGTTRVSDLAAPNPSRGLTVFKGRIYFAGAGNNKLWVSDGTDAGTMLFKQFRLIGDNEVSQLTVVGDTMYFVARDQAHGRELWKTDGTVDGTVLVADLSDGTSSELQLFADYKGEFMLDELRTMSKSALASRGSTSSVLTLPSSGKNTSRLPVRSAVDLTPTFPGTSEAGPRLPHAGLR